MGTRCQHVDASVSFASQEQVTKYWSETTGVVLRALRDHMVMVASAESEVAYWQLPISAHTNTLICQPLDQALTACYDTHT